MAVALASSSERLQRLKERLLSQEVQVPELQEVEEVSARLQGKEVEKVFRDHVPGVETFLFRQKSGRFALHFAVTAYQKGLRAFQDMPVVNQHLTSLLRLVVHYGEERGTGAAALLREVAEGFMDCQAVQARTIERVGSQLCGLAPDFKGHVTRLVSEYKILAVKMLAVERLAQGLAKDYDAMPTHYENRLTADLGSLLGLDAGAVRLAALDGHASSRFETLCGGNAKAAAKRCREIFDVDALLQAFVAEVNSFGAESPPESIAALFLAWVGEHLADKHAVFDEATCSRVEIDAGLALCVFEVLFLGSPAASDAELFRGSPARSLFLPPGRAIAAGAAAAPEVSASPAVAPREGEVATREAQKEEKGEEAASSALRPIDAVEVLWGSSRWIGIAALGAGAALYLNGGGWNFLKYASAVI